MKIDITKPVKFHTPNDEFEASTSFDVMNFNEVTNRVYIRKQNPGNLEQQILVSVTDLVNA